MMWKAIGKSVCGTSHQQSGKGCEDALVYSIVATPANEEVLICCVSDGAGSAAYAAEASALVTGDTVALLSGLLTNNKDIDEAAILTTAETLYEKIKQLAIQRNQPLSEFSCTYLGCILFPQKAIFFQVGDGAIVRDDGNNNYVPVWWPQNGEYSNTTFFLIDDDRFSNLKIAVLEEAIQEVALFTDGLQWLALNNENRGVHQPFFAGMYTWLRKATRAEDQAILNRKLEEYLDSNAINTRTDDDKTLFLATRITHA